MDQRAGQRTRRSSGAVETPLSVYGSQSGAVPLLRCGVSDAAQPSKPGPREPERCGAGAAGTLFEPVGEDVSRAGQVIVEDRAGALAVA